MAMFELKISIQVLSVIDLTFSLFNFGFVTLNNNLNSQKYCSISDPDAKHALGCVPFVWSLMAIHSCLTFLVNEIKLYPPISIPRLLAKATIFLISSKYFLSVDSMLKPLPKLKIIISNPTSCICRRTSLMALEVMFVMWKKMGFSRVHGARVLIIFLIDNPRRSKLSYGVKRRLT